MRRKIEFAINTINEGAGYPWHTGPKDKKWLKGIVDPRELLGFWDNPQDQYIEFMSFGQDGTYYVWAKYSSSRGGSDSLSKWIYIPNGVKISGKEIVELESKAKDEELVDVLEQLFSSEFPYEPDGTAIHVANGNGNKKYAVRYYDTKDQLADIIGEKRFQKYYNDYKVIFLIDRQSGIKAYDDVKIDDLTDRPMMERIIVYRPYSLEIANMFGLNVNLYSGDVCLEEKTELYAYKGELIDVTAKRNGFDDIDCKIKACENKQCCEFEGKEEFTWSKLITKNFFQVYDGENNPDGKAKTISLEELDIYINGHLIKEEGVKLTEKQGEDCTIEVKDKKKAPRYELFKKEHAYIFLTEGKKFPIHLEKKSNSYAYRIQLSNKEVVKLAINSKKGDFNEKAPFCGYVVDTDPFSMRSKEKMLVLNSFYLLKLIMIGFGIGVVVASIIFFTLFYHGKEDNTSPNTDDTSSVAVLCDSGNVNGKEAYSLEAAINYLDSHKSWNRDSMERYDDLKDLFDAMNYFRLSTVIDDYSRLKQSKNYAILVETAKKNIRNGWDPKTGEHDPLFNKDGKEDISFWEYICWIDQNRNKEETKKEETKKKETKKEETKKEETKKKETKKKETKSGTLEKIKVQV